MERFRYRFGHWNYKYPARTERGDLDSPGKVWEQRMPPPPSKKKMIQTVVMNFRRLALWYR